MDFSDVSGIPTQTGSGTGLSGQFDTRFEVTSDGCASDSILKAPKDGDVEPLNVKVTQTDGALEMEEIEADLRGGVTIKNEFDVGGATIIDRGGQKGNILRTVRITGAFTDKDSFEGSGYEKLQGRVETESFDCTFSFDVSGIRKK